MKLAKSMLVVVVTCYLFVAFLFSLSPAIHRLVFKSHSWAQQSHCRDTVEMLENTVSKLVRSEFCRRLFSASELGNGRV